jgi:hypothetical protein
VARIERRHAAIFLLLGAAACAPARTLVPLAAPVREQLPYNHPPDTESPDPSPDDDEPVPQATTEPIAEPPAPAVLPSPKLPTVPSAKPSAGASPTQSTPTADPLLERVLGGGGKTLKAVLSDRQRYRFQVLYGAVVEKAGVPNLERHGYFADAEYFFPASSMKVPLALASYERVPELRAAKHPALDRDATLELFPLAGGESPYATSLSRETWRALIVSDNASANRILSFVGHREAHESLWGLGLSSVRVHTGFATGQTADPVTLSPRIDIVPKDGQKDSLPPRKSTLTLPATRASRLDVGNAVVVDGKKVAGPMSFAEKNAASLRDLQDALVRIVRPELLPAKAPKSQASRDDLDYLKKTLSTPPSKSGLPGYDRNVVLDYQLNPFLRGLERVRSRDRLEIHVKVGQAYGFLTTNAYVVEKATGKCFFLIATIYANPNEVLNDDLYAYDQIAFPALADVAEAIAGEALAN